MERRENLGLKRTVNVDVQVTVRARLPQPPSTQNRQPTARIRRTTASTWSTVMPAAGLTTSS